MKFHSADISKDVYLDDFSGKNAPPSYALQVQIPETSKKSKGNIPPEIFHAASLPKPQLKFKRTPDNSNNTPWKPPLRSKPHAKVPLDDDFARMGTLPPSYEFPHPYRYEINHISYPERIFEASIPSPPSSFEDTPVQWVATKEELDDLVRDLKAASEFAVDLEHHDYRTFAGFLCLMQLSTRSKDYIVDILLLREELEVLNEVFTDPTITKVSISCF